MIGFIPRVPLLSTGLTTEERMLINISISAFLEELIKFGYLIMTIGFMPEMGNRKQYFSGIGVIFKECFRLGPFKSRP